MKVELSECPLRSRVITNIIKSRCKEQLGNSMKYAKLAGLEKDPLVKEWHQFKQALTTI
jgi:hypothetical protein